MFKKCTSKFNGDISLKKTAMQMSLAEMTVDKIRTFTLDDESTLFISLSLLFVMYDANVLKQDCVFCHKPQGKLHKRVDNTYMLIIKKIRYI